ncbi:MAG: beta-ketoacyl synthase N-terminal-like domain-containing protein [Bacteroidetes bacterium]|nr:beta-ketoacyl synthase N-terminal-like domain-containing protein [Bacteroidota bacterium]
MTGVYIASDNIITSLGFTTTETIDKFRRHSIGLQMISDPALSPVRLPLSCVDTLLLEEKFRSLVSSFYPEFLNTAFTRMEKMFILSIQDSIHNSGLNLKGEETILIMSTTKGNIDLIGEEKKNLFDPKRLFLWEMARVIQDFFRLYHSPIVVSNACISGSLAIGIGARFIRSGKFRNAIVTGGDILSKFVISGFQSFQALSPEPCKPFDISRNGLSLGEGCATMVLTADETIISGDKITVAGFATSNDANHISGPSRTGEELAFAIGQSLSEAGIQASDIDFISAHGTATVFNDEMESRALTLAKLNDSPVNSFKGYIGHTLGAAGIIESVATIQSMNSNMLFKSAGFSESGVPEKIRVVEANNPANLIYCLKTASGFGGCNSSLVFIKQ